jgi:hypothetical protein
MALSMRRRVLRSARGLYGAWCPGEKRRRAVWVKRIFASRQRLREDQRAMPAHMGQRLAAPGTRWPAVAEPPWHRRTRVGARCLGHEAMGHHGPLAHRPLNFSLNFEINTNLEIQNEGLPNVQKYSNFVSRQFET